VRYINAVLTTVQGTPIDMFVADGQCHLFTQAGQAVQWHVFDTSEADKELYTCNPSPTSSIIEFPLKNDDGWVFRMANRDFSTDIQDKASISDAYFLKCQDGEKELWYLSALDIYLYAQDGVEFVDMAYEQNNNVLYVLFNGDNHLYRFDGIDAVADFQKKALVQRENATMKYETMHSVSITNKGTEHEFVYLDYKSPYEWDVVLYGNIGGKNGRETWHDNSSQSSKNFYRYNTMMFGDSLFNESQLRFQNVSKNKEMFDILDVDEVGNCYYGVFKDKSKPTSQFGFDVYSTFRMDASTGIVRKLPYLVVNPSLYRTSDDLYSLFVLAIHRDNESDPWRLRLQEVSVPDDDMYKGRVIELQQLFESNGIEAEDLVVNELILSKFQTDAMKSSFFVLDNKDTGFHKVGYVNNFDQMSIDNVYDLKEQLRTSIMETLMQKHMDEMHHGELGSYFDTINGKVN
jgi:hypothetical protein